MQELKEIIFFMYEYWYITALFLAIICSKEIVSVKCRG